MLSLSSAQKAVCLKDGVEKRQYLARLLIGGGTRLLREKLDSIHKRENLELIFNDTAIRTKLKDILLVQEWDLLYSRNSPENVYLPSILQLLRTIHSFVPRVTDWRTIPDGFSFEEDLARIERYCSSVYRQKMTDARFNYLWKAISEAFLRIAGGISPEKRSEWEISIDQFLQDPLTSPEGKEYVHQLQLREVRRLVAAINMDGNLLYEHYYTSRIPTAWQSLKNVVTGAFTPLVKEVGRLLSPGETGAYGTTTPYEILARGPLALEIYNKALEEGKATVRRVPIMLIGQGRTGKTSLKKSLKGDRFDADEESTRGIEMDPSHWRVTNEIWKTGECDRAACSASAISFDHHAARLIARDLTDKNLVSKATTGESSQASEMDRSFSTGQVNSSEGPNQTSSNATILTQGQEKLQMPDDLANLTTKLICEDIEMDKEGEIYSILWDFGGQSVYYVTHPLFLTSRAIYLLVCNLSQNPSDAATPLLKQGMFTKLEDSFGSKTNLDYLHSWLSSVASLASNDDEAQTGHPSEKLPKKLPPVILVCTHADQPYGGRDSASAAAEIFGFLQGKSYSGHLLDSVFAVDNTKSGTLPECPEVLRLRKEILAVAKELPQMNEEIPLKWLRFEKELQVKIKEGCKWIAFNEARQIAVEVCHISDEREFVTLMKLLHDQRIIIHFDDTPNLNKMVVLDIQWLIDVFKKVITIKPYDGKGIEHKDLWIKLEKTGILEEKLLEHAWGPLFDHQESLESLIEIMEKFSLLCVWPSSDASKEYLVPSMLMSHPPEDITRLVKSSQIPSLYLTFNSSQVPIGLFPRIVLHLYQWCSKEWPSPLKPQFYQNFARFHIDPEAGCSVILLCHSSFIEIVVHRAHDEVRNLSERVMAMANVCPNLVDHTPDVIVARAVRRQVELMLECMRKGFAWLRNMECKMKVLCSVCCPEGTVRYCHDHGIKECKQEECLHFWSEAELQSGQQFCDRSAVAGNLKLNPQQFRSWFAVVDDQQQAISECAARELPLPEENETMALVLSTGVVKCLQSTCDASNVVAQLRETLELHQEALENPDPETTRLIRSFAMIAKSENRPDVVEHLRQMTPAGATGPLLPDGLDVRNIPLSHFKMLTISLCGGEEWKLVAEKLGLSPAEIRYLDNRTINPCDAALIHGANQRLINVGALYDVLLDCGLPAIADLL